MFTQSSCRWKSFPLYLPVLLLAVVGCGVEGDVAAGGAQGAKSARSATPASPSAPASSQGPLTAELPPVGDAELSPAVRGKKVLVVGDSWAERLGEGMVKVASSGNVIVNAGVGGCGIMLPDLVDGERVRSDCLEWPQKWPEYIAKYRPDAVLLRTTTWDLHPQSFDGAGVQLTIEHPGFRRRFEKNMGKAIDILAKNGTPVYLTTDKLQEEGIWRSSSIEMNKVIKEVSQKYKSRGVHILDLAEQLCNRDDCPSVIDGRRLYDETSHPVGWSRDRLATWILNSMFTRSTGATS
ncbi:SGNH hydrolase domain-containing protein [Streptomyces sp. V4I8]|uniref:DUF459 domain-containing protein n=1 Tax=Streptomyces sp. V4I8 TaxID=3156469 RepID=UPI003514C1A7